MRKNQASFTALGIAAARAVESERPQDERICYDPLAVRFIPAWLYIPLRYTVRSGYSERRGPGVNGFLAARERYIDDALSGALGAGLEQLVILGAGYDTRAYRLDLPAQIQIFEVDHPATQQDKKAHLEKILGGLPGQVTFVPIDFNLQPLSEGLFTHAYNPALKTFFIWQGVTMYLSPEAVDETLAFVLRNSAPGSAIVFDYVYRSALAEKTQHAEIRNMRRYRFVTGEGLTFGLAEGTVEAFLKERGFRQVKDVNAADLHRLYFSGKNAARKVAGGYGIALGTT